MVDLSIEEIAPRFASYQVAVLLAEDLTITPTRPPELERAIAAAEEHAMRAFGGRELGEIAEVRAWRQAYKAFGVKGTSHRSSVERLLKRAAQGIGLPRVNALVDAYNLISLRYRMPAGADDLDHVTQPQAFRFARPGESFLALGEQTPAPDPPEPGEVIYADAEKVLCRRWNWKQDARSVIREDTRRAVLTVQTLADEAGRLDAAASELAALLETVCGARCAWRSADAAHPVVSIALP